MVHKTVTATMAAAAPINLHHQGGDAMPLIILIVLSLILSGCMESQPDYTPIGDGLKAIGICIVCFAVVQVLGALVDKNKP